MEFNKVPGLKAVYSVKGDDLVKVYGEEINLDTKKLVSFLKENAKIGEEESRKLDMGTLLGFAMILDNLGVAYMGGYVMFVDAVKTNWNTVLDAFKEVLVK